MVSPSPTVVASGPAPPGSAEHDGQRAFAHVQALAGTIGPRVSGTPVDAEAIRYIQEQFESFGYDVEIMRFTFQDNPFKVDAIHLNGAKIDALALAGSGTGRVEGEAVYVGLASPEGLAGRDLTGKIAIADRGTIRFGDKLDNVQAANAAGLIVVNNESGSFRGSLGKRADIPVLGVSKEDGDRLKAAAQTGDKVTIEVTAGGQGEAVNVIARPKPGARCRGIVGGHHDSVPAVPGANDNASGTANVIELARALAAAGRNEGLCFVTFGAEESGLHGSQALAARLQKEGALPDFMVNLDVTGTESDTEVIGSPEPTRRALALAGELGIPAKSASLPENLGSDHVSFAQVGVPVAYLSSGDFAVIHTPADTVDKVSSAGLDRVGDLAFALISALAQ